MWKRKSENGKRGMKYDERRRTKRKVKEERKYDDGVEKKKGKN
jgi:hypothetical protein